MTALKRATDRYGESAPHDSPFARASQEWDRRIGEPVVQARNWRAAAFCGFAIAALAVGGLIYQGATKDVATYIVPIDRYGQPGRIELAGRAYTPSTAEIGYFLADWVTKTRSKSFDPIVIRDDWTTAYHFVVGQAIGQLNDYAKGHDPFALAGQQAVTVQVISVLQRSPNTFQVQWRETTYDQGAQTAVANWTGLLTVKLSPPKTEAELRANPLGVYITAFPVEPRPMSRFPRPRPLGGVVLAALAVEALSASAQPAGPGVASLPPPPASAPPGVIAPRLAAQAPPPTPVRRRKRLRALPGEAAVRGANAAARSYPTAQGYINSTLYYDYEAGRLYEVETSPHFLTAILLRPGEKLLAKAAGDTVRWVLGETAEGSGPNQQVVVLLKPMRGGLRTNLVLTTDQRTYLVEAASRDGRAYTSAVSWNYPQEAMQALAAAQAAKAAQEAPVVAQTALPIDQLHFGYRIEPVHAKRPRWMPDRVFDDGARTYIKFPVNMAATDAPPLFLVGPRDTAELVNYRYINGYYVVDRLMDAAELRIGEKPQVIVRITRTAGG